VHGQAPGADSIQVHLSGTPLEGQLPDQWQDVPLNPGTHTFDGSVPTPAGGWYSLEVRAMKAGDLVAGKTVDHVGVGEVFVIAGQSNSTNFGSEKLQTQTGRVSSFSGTAWQLANDPQPGVQDNSPNGSPWPAFGDDLYEKIHVPIGIAATGFGGTSVSEWQPGAPRKLFEGMMQRIQELGPHGFRAVLWHQGENDEHTSTQDYVRLLTNVIETSKKEAGWDFPWFVAQASYHSESDPESPEVRAAQKELWDTHVALKGPDTDTLRGDNRYGIHMSGKGLRAHGRMWADLVGAYLDKVLTEQKP